MESSGKTGITAGRSSGAADDIAILSEQQSRQAAATRPRHLRPRSRRLEHGEETLTRRASIPISIELKNRQQVIASLFQPTRGGQRSGELIAGFMISRVCSDPALEAGG
jgi:hypothetical protein